MVGREIVWEVGRPHGAQEGVLPSSEEEAHRPLKFPPIPGGGGGALLLSGSDGHCTTAGFPDFLSASKCGGRFSSSNAVITSSAELLYTARNFSRKYPEYWGNIAWISRICLYCPLAACQHLMYLLMLGHLLRLMLGMLWLLQRGLSSLTQK